jgi:hypothetical protein
MAQIGVKTTWPKFSNLKHEPWYNLGGLGVIFNSLEQGKGTMDRTVYEQEKKTENSSAQLI